jgi:glutamine synthetase
MAEIPSTVLFSIKNKGVRFIRHTMVDNAGLIRSKAVNAAVLPSFADGVGLTPAQQALPVMYDAVSPGAGLTPAGEVFMRPDWGTLRALPYAPGHARVMTDIYDGDEPWGHCTRSFLRRMIERAAREGFEVKAAFENEFVLGQRTPEGFRPVDETVFAQTSGLDQQVDVINAITAALEAQDVVPEMVYAEAGPGQFELPVRYRDALGAADQQVIFRETVGAVARRFGLIASFVPKLFPERAGNGAHLHVSLWLDERNCIPDPDDPTAISSLAGAFAAGVLNHLPALMALTTPSTNSYKRIRPRFWSGAYTCWGYGNREAAIRVPPTGAGGRITNLELKTVDPTCNPYLALGAVIAAGLDGLLEPLVLGEPVQVDPADIPEDERQRRGIRQLPSTLAESLAALEADELLRDALGPQLFQSFTAVRRAEWEAMKDLSHEDEVALLLERY